LDKAAGDKAVSPNFGTLPGSGVVVDVDLFRGSIDELAAL
jgi:hypothetical protein